MKVAVMQPYLFPYIGYFQLMQAVDVFVVLDNVNFIKKGWINRNQILTHQGPQRFNLPVRKVSQNRLINQHYFLDLRPNLERMSRTISQTYAGAPNISILNDILDAHRLIDSDNVAKFLTESLRIFAKYLKLDCKIKVASDIQIAPELTGQDRILEIAKSECACDYINLSGGKELYNKESFEDNNIQLHFIENEHSPYHQANHKGSFVPFMSMLDVIVNCSAEELTTQLNSYKLS